MNSVEQRECSTLAARKMNLIVGIDSPRRGEVAFLLHIGNRRALPKRFLRQHCRHVGPLRSVLRWWEALRFDFPFWGTHRLIFRFTYCPIPNEEELARELQVDVSNFYLKQDLEEAFVLLQDAGFRLVGKVGWGEEHCPAQQYAIWCAGGKGSGDFPVAYPRYPSSVLRRCWLGPVREWSDEAAYNLRGKG